MKLSDGKLVDIDTDDGGLDKSRGLCRLKDNICLEIIRASGYNKTIAHRRAWRNGRRARFRTWCPYGRGGSTPLARTTHKTLAMQGLFLFFVGPPPDKGPASADFMLI